MGETVGLVHIAHISSTEVEFGFMVAESHRKIGVSGYLMEYSLTWCRNRGLPNVYMHCLGWNEPIIHLTKKYGLEINRDHGDADAYITLPSADVFTFQHEAILTQSSKLAEFTRNTINTFKSMMPAQ